MKSMEPPRATCANERRRALRHTRTHRTAFRWQSSLKAALCTVAILACVMLVMAQQASELNGYVTYPNKSPVQGVVLTMGNYSVVTDKNGFYRMTFLKPGVRTITISPPGKATRSRPVKILPTPTRLDIQVDW